MATVDEIVEDNIKLAYYFLTRFNLLDNPDAESYALEALFKAASTFKPEAGTKFSTYAACVISNSLRMYLRECSKKKVLMLVSYDAPAYASGDGSELNLIDILEGPNHAEDAVFADELRKHIGEALRATYDSLTSPLHKDVFKFWVQSDFKAKQREISVACNTSQPNASRILSSIRHKIKQQLEDYL